MNTTLIVTLVVGIISAIATLVAPIVDYWLMKHQQSPNNPRRVPQTPPSTDSVPVHQPQSEQAGNSAFGSRAERKRPLVPRWIKFLFLLAAFAIVAVGIGSLSSIFYLLSSIGGGSEPTTFGYLGVMLVGIAISGTATLWVRSSYSKYSKQMSASGLTGA